MDKTTLITKEAIRDLLNQKKSYGQIAAILGLKDRLVRKWGQIIKKRRLFGAGVGPSAARVFGHV